MRFFHHVRTISGNWQGTGQLCLKFLQKHKRESNCRKAMKLQRGEEFGGSSSLSCASKPPGELLQQRGEDGQFQPGGTKPLCHRTHWQPAQTQHHGNNRDKPCRISPWVLNWIWQFHLAFFFFLLLWNQMFGIKRDKLPPLFAARSSCFSVRLWKGTEIGTGAFSSVLWLSIYSSSLHINVQWQQIEEKTPALPKHNN